MTANILQLAREALADDEKASPGPWLVGHKGWPYTKGGPPYVETTQIGNDGLKYGGDCWSPDLDDDETSSSAEADASFIAAARSREPQLAKACIEQAAKLERYKTSVGAMLHYDMRAVVSGTPEERSRLERDSLLAELAAMTKARDEACELGIQHVDSRLEIIDGIAYVASADGKVKEARALFVADRDRLTQLRKVGQGEK